MRWEYMVLCPDSEAGYESIFQVGEEGWEAVCSWAEEVERPTLEDPARVVRTNHILFKRPVEESPGPMGPPR